MWRTRFRSRVWPAKLASGCGPWSAGTPRYRTDGYAGLKTAPRIDAGTHRLPGDLVQSIEGLALSKPRPTIATIHRKVTGICGIHGWPVPSYAVAHQYRPLGQDELLFVLQRHWRSLGKTLDPEDFTDAQAIAAIARVTRSNFRLLERLIPQIQRVLKINELDTITNDVIEGAQSTLVIGVT